MPIPIRTNQVNYDNRKRIINKCVIYNLVSSKSFGKLTVFNNGDNTRDEMFTWFFTLELASSNSIQFIIKIYKFAPCKVNYIIYYKNDYKLDMLTIELKITRTSILQVN